MLTKIHQKMRWNSERGDAELVSLLFMLPFSIMLMLSFIDLSVYFNVRASVQQQALNGARLTALYGGSSAGLTTNPDRKNTGDIIDANIYSGGRCQYAGGCPTGYKPDATCYVLNNDGSRATRATRAGQQAVCEIKYKFAPVVQGDIFGFVGITTGQFTVKGTYYTETGFGD